MTLTCDLYAPPQAPGKWASLLKGSAAPAPKANSAAQPAPPAAAPAPAPVTPDQPAAAEPPSQATPAAAVQAVASTAPLEETAEEKIKRLEAEVRFVAGRRRSVFLPFMHVPGCLSGGRCFSTPRLVLAADVSLCKGAMADM